MSLVTYKFNSEYLVGEINSRQQSIAETTVHPSPFSVQLRMLTHLKYCAGFLPKIYVWKICGLRISLVVCYFRICVISESYFWYRCTETGTDCVMLNNAIFVPGEIYSCQSLTLKHIKEHIIHTLFNFFQ